MLGVSVIRELSERDIRNYMKISKRFLKAILKNHTILMQGGGNFGDIWRGCTKLRNSIIRLFPNHKIIMLPQTINYRNKNLFKLDNKVYSSALDLTIMTRSLESFNSSRKMFPTVRSVLMPDLAFMIGDVKPINKPKVNILVLRRTDKETRFKSDRWESLLEEKCGEKCSFLVSYILRKL